MHSMFNSKKLTVILVLPLLLVVFALAYLLMRPSSLSPVPSSSQLVRICGQDEARCHETGLPYQDAALPIETRLDDLMGRMTNAEKIGQMALIEKNSIRDPNDIAKYGLGALMSGSGGKPDDNTPEGWLRMVQGFKAYGQKTRLSIPLLYGVDANHGHSNVPGATIFPHSIGLGATKNPDLVGRVAKATAEEVAATGINWVYSPDLDVVRDIRWGRTYETFGSDPKNVGALGRAYIEGLQAHEKDGLKIAAAAKHFLGNGSTEWGSSINKDFRLDQGVTNINEDELRNIHLEPFRQAVEADVKSVMVGLNRWNGEKITTNKYLLTDVLKKELGFQGFVFSDWYGVYENERNKYDALVESINAGIDMVMLPFDYVYFCESLHKALANGDISQTRVDDAVRRILRAKFEIGLFDESAGSAPASEDIGSAAHRELARTSVRESLVLLKNVDVLPIKKNTAKILVAGSAADNIGKQSGGWTVEWQGIDGNWIPGTSILKGIQDAVGGDAEVEYDLAGKFTDQDGLADVGIAVVGEKPYSEGWGDQDSPKLTDQDMATIQSLKKVSKKIVVIIISGRPLEIRSSAQDWDAIIAAWLPGSEGQGVADVLFGDFDFTGTLPLSWGL
ncbi:MAG: glycoside hydrolase family 3 N-terminal domain-containing protein [Patescibacteria group bacterium]|nr:glycoside hydrolase family 3 N-terminal domain-containing protein [Patescibacteria group bacterium]